MVKDEQGTRRSQRIERSERHAISSGTRRNTFDFAQDAISYAKLNTMFRG
jgi:hypothetical protein